ncbi:MAG: hypothetical protein Q8N51_12585, partial [Gammaproteobacteria bacterium]|nr:hypothetical protein [Gammaproteobacteria bacterium]
HAEDGVANGYGQVLDRLQLLNHPPFDAATTLFSKRYDIGLGCEKPLPTVPPSVQFSIPLMPSTACAPVLTTNVFSYAAALPANEPVWQRLGVGTHITDKAYCDQGLYNVWGDPTTGRLDHILVIPPKPPPGVLPAFVIPNDAEPYVLVDGHPDPGQQGQDSECFSDHKAVIGIVPIVRIEEKLSFNPKMTHDIRYVVKRVENHTGDSAGGAEFFADQWVRDAAGVNHQTAHGVFQSDSDVINPNWGVTKPAGNSDQLGFELALWEDDSVGPNDEYDTTLWAGTKSLSRFRHGTSLWALRDSSGVQQKVYCFEELAVDCFGVSVHGTNLIVKSHGTSSQTGEYASILHGLVAKEAP